MDLLSILNGSAPEEKPDKNALAFRAASLGRLELLKKHCENGADMNMMHNGFSCLHTACKKNHSHIVEYLLQNYSPYPSASNGEGGGDGLERTDICEQLSQDGRTARMIAAFEGNIDVLRLLQAHISARSSSSALASSLDINAQDSVGNTALHHCCFGGNLACAQYLVDEGGADYLLKNKEGMLPIQFAVAGNHTALVSYLHKLPLTTSGNSGVTPGSDDASESGINSLHRAAMHGSLETLQMLIDENIIAGNSPMPNLNTALHLSSQRGMGNIVNYLITHPSIDVDINAQNEFGLSPLHFACIGGYSSVVASLLRHGACPNLRTASQATPLHLAAGSGSHEICEMLVENNARIDLWAEDSDGMTAIDMALSSSYKKLASRLAEWAYVEDRTQRLVESTCFLSIL